MAYYWPDRPASPGNRPDEDGPGVAIDPRYRRRRGASPYPGEFMAYGPMYPFPYDVFPGDEDLRGGPRWGEDNAGRAPRPEDVRWEPRHGHNPRGFWQQARDEFSSWFGDEGAEHRREMDARETHRGRGPKGYQRDQNRILEDINDRLTDDHFLDASNIEVTVENGEVMLFGTVTSRAAKRRAEDLVDTVSGVTHCQNNLRVKLPAG
ncbi:BON domain-containing protein [Radicibacter daui]|uniref:BON domain-containing protein n=1 Tax=Radicibacter daui TaxID=3064829 RepID=UPI004046E7C0